MDEFTISITRGEAKMLIAGLVATSPTYPGHHSKEKLAYFESQNLMQRIENATDRRRVGKKKAETPLSNMPGTINLDDLR